MCGIAGILGSFPDRDASLRAMTKALAHRGPDGDGYWSSPECALGHRRLAVIDLSQLGAQPMAADSGGPVISYNGEVYNFDLLRRGLEAKGHTFRSRTDTEVVLRAYMELGDDFVSQLDGMFALAIWDPKERRLVLARDRWGQKPLFYAELGGSFAFASEIKALLVSPQVSDEIDLDALDCYLTTNVIPSPLSLYRGIRRLEPGTIMVRAGDGRSTVRRFASELPLSQRRPIAMDAAVERVDALLGAAVRRQLVADVPVGIFLSGGIDSSLVMAKVAEAGIRCSAYTVTFDEAGRSELPFAAAAAREFALPLEVVPVGAEAFRDPERVIDHFDEPFADVAAPALLELSRQARTVMTVALTGDGGDELFGGYETHVGALWLHRLRSGRWPLAAVGRLASRLPDRSIAFRSRARAATRAASLLAGAPLEALTTLRSNLSETTRRALFAPGFLQEREKNDAWWAARPRTDRGVGLDALFDPLADRFLGDLFLHKADVSSMAVGLECRAPFLDNELAAFAATLPFQLQVRGLRGKVVLRSLMTRLFGKKLGARRKMGFSPPLDLWLRRELRGTTEERLRPRTALVSQFVSSSAVGRLLDEHMGARANHRRVLWSLLLLESFLQRRRLRRSIVQPTDGSARIQQSAE